jgi:predicted nicotinamide N-methyase
MTGAPPITPVSRKQRIPGPAHFASICGAIVDSHAQPEGRQQGNHRQRAHVRRTLQRVAKMAAADHGNAAVFSLLTPKRSTSCWLASITSSSSSSPVDSEPHWQQPIPASRSALGRTSPHLVITTSCTADSCSELNTATEDSAGTSGSEGSTRVYSLLERSASVEINLPAGFERIGLGAVVWSSAIGLSIWLSRAAHTGQLRLKGARVLELGAGVGLPGLMCAQLGADAPSQVTLTDLSTQLIDRMRENAEHNAKAGTPLPEAALLNWDEQAAADSALSCGEYDVIIGADLVYNPAHVSQLVKTVLPRLATGLSTLVLVQPGRYTSDAGGQEVFDTRNGWEELKVSLDREGSVELHRLRLSLLDSDALGTATAELQGASGNDGDGAMQEFACAELELLIFHKEVLCLMPPR